ncbi:alpha/beta fold hydrolase [Microbacterium marinilacus]|uniref:Alpha/beta hydrolase n=1 Tax=Microbacterium marinilacus TaxID=415209 RepID=A0ABP7B659_9MICO|nr:alpha/beta hydrolase [Microbacterium marinilacus]
MTENTPPSPHGDEFSYLPGQAARLGRPVPPVARVSLALDDGRTLSALRFGGGSRPGIVLLHGAGLNAHTWDNTAIAIGADTLAVDLPGHGDSSWRSDADYRPRILAPDAAQALEKWAQAPVHLVGHSLGGLTAAALAARRPDLVASLTIVDITPGVAGGAGSAQLRRFYEQTSFPSREDAVQRALSFGLGGALEDARRGVFHNTRVLDDGDYGPGTVEWKHHFARIAQQGLSAADAAPPVVDGSGWEDLAAVAAPITLVRAARGFVDEQAAAEFARRVPRAEIVSIDAPHNVQEAAPVALAALISPTAEGR